MVLKVSCCDFFVVAIYVHNKVVIVGSDEFFFLFSLFFIFSFSKNKCVFSFIFFIQFGFFFIAICFVFFKIFFIDFFFNFIPYYLISFIFYIKFGPYFFLLLLDPN